MAYLDLVGFEYAALMESRGRRLTRLCSCGAPLWRRLPAMLLFVWQLIQRVKFSQGVVRATEYMRELPSVTLFQVAVSGSFTDLLLP